MTAEEVLRLLHDLPARAWLDGGWGVDALLGEQTRDHDDLDLVVRREDLDVVVRHLRDDGFEVERDLLPTAFALRHPDGRAVDLHPVDPTDDGGGDQDLGGDSGLGVAMFHYDTPVTGVIGGRAVPCCSVATQLAAHTGYEPDEEDRADVAALVDRFALAPPESYR